MLIETVELTLSHVGLGSLTEYGAMLLFANAFSHRITQGTGRSAKSIVDQNGATLYPAYGITSLTVPPTCPLSRFRLWDEVSVGIDSRTFGGLIVQSTGVLTPGGMIAPDPATWDATVFPMWRAMNTYIIDGAGPTRVSSPQHSAVSQLPSIGAPPSTLETFRNIRAAGGYIGMRNISIASPRPISIPLAHVRDIPIAADRAYASH